MTDACHDRTAWNALVRAHPAGHFFQSWEWGEVQEGLGATPIRLIASDEDGSIRGGIQALLFHGQRTFAYVPRGPVADQTDAQSVDDLVSDTLALVRAAGADLVRIEPEWMDEDGGERWLARGFARSRQSLMPPRTIVVDLTPEEPAIWAGFRSTTRNRIRVAERQGVTIRKGGAADLPAFLQLYADTTSRHRVIRTPDVAFIRALECFGPDEAGLFLAEREGTLLAGIMVFVWGRLATYLWGASSASPDHRRLSPNQLLHWTAMRWARAVGGTGYDLFGIPDHDRETLEREYGRASGGMWNLYHFKRGFGGDVLRHEGTFDYVF